MLILDKVTKSFAGSFKPVLNDINLVIKAREFCVLLGANGSGKSTLLKVISGECLPDSGSVAVNSMVAQVVQDVNKGTVAEMTLLENIALGVMRHLGPKLGFYGRYRQTVIRALENLGLGLEEYINRPLDELSGGQRQVVATIMSINSGSGVLLLDEHTSALDPKTQVLLMEYTARCARELGITVIMVTHKMEDAIKYGDRLLMMQNGKIALDLQGSDKQSLTVQRLLSLFHQYEDQYLTSGGAYDN